MSLIDVANWHSFHALFLITWLADGDSLMCCIAMMGRQIAKISSTFCEVLFLMHASLFGLSPAAILKAGLENENPDN